MVKVKAMKRRSELEAIVMAEATGCGKCNDLAGVAVLGPLLAPGATWKIATLPKHPTHLVSVECATELNMIVGRLTQEYDLSGDQYPDQPPKNDRRGRIVDLMSGILHACQKTKPPTEGSGVVK